MAPIEATPPSVAAEDNVRIKFLDTIAASTGIPTPTEFNAGTDITYSLTPDGWTPSQDQATIVDDRLTLAQALERPGKKTKGLTLKYVYGTATDVAAAELVEGTTGFLVVRVGVPNESAGAAAQKVTVWPILAGEQMEDAPPTNGVLTMSQKCFVTGEVLVRVPLTGI